MRAACRGRPYWGYNYMRKTLPPLLRASLASAVSVTALQFAAASAQIATSAPATFEIESQSLAKALVKYSEQSHMVIVAPVELVSGKTSAAVQGVFPPEQALNNLLTGTGLTAQSHKSGALTLQLASVEEGRSPARPLVMAQAATTTPQPAPALASSPAEDKVSVQETVIVTGVRGAPRSIIDSPTPIDVFSADDIQQGSPTGVFESLRYLVPSFNLPTRAGGGTATVIATGGLRGLNPDHTLVLVNGKRRHKTALINSVSSLYNGAAGVDLNMIPSSAIARIEVLRDGAAAQYGSDAIAGVINIILKDSSEGGEASVSFGENFDRSDGEFLTGSLNQGYAIGESGFAHFSYSYMDRNASNRAVPIADTVNLYPLLPGNVRDPREATIDRLVTTNYGAFPQTSHAFGVNLGYETNGLELYAFGTYGARTSVLDWSYRAPNNIASLPEVYPNGFRPRLTIYEDDFEIAGGIRGNYNGWDWDLSSNYGTDITDWENDNGLNASLGPTSPTHFEVGRLISSEWVNAFDATRPYDLGGSGELQVSFGFQHRLEKYEIEEGDAASWAAGTYVRPVGQQFAGQLQTPGSQATPGFRPDDAGSIDRNNLSVYGELGWSATDKLFLSGALRFESFDDDAGEELIYKLNGRYELTDWLAARASFNTGFRAPTLAQQAYSSTTSQFRDLDGDGENELLLLKNLPVNSAAAIALGASPLVPETSENISFGFTLTPLNNLAITIDAYRIDVDDRIAVTTTFSSLDARIRNILTANGLPAEISGQYYTNAIDTRTEGIDVVGTYTLPTDSFGDFAFKAGYNKNETEITGIIDNPPELAALGNVVIFDRSKQNALTTAIPDSKITLGLDWTFGGFTANARTTRFGSYTVQNATNPAADYDVDPAWITDLEIGYAISDALSVFAGANNVFNEYPQEIAAPGATTGSNMYNTFAPFGFTGGSWFVRGVYKW